MNADKENSNTVNVSFADGENPKYHMQRDDEEDFLDEGTGFSQNYSEKQIIY